MFAALNGNVPQFETRKALLILNMQNDSFDVRAGNMMLSPDHDFAEKIKHMVPFYRRLGDIVWVRTEYGPDPPSSPEASTSSSTGEDDLLAADTPSDSPSGSATGSTGPSAASSQHYNEKPSPSSPSRQTQNAMRQASARSRTDQRNGVLDRIEKDDHVETDAYLKKPRKGQKPDMYCAGTRGAAIIDSLLPIIDEDDMMIVKNHYSALDSTPLLMSLRMNLVTHVYLCGCLSNVSILTTAQDAVRHGFEVTVVEDCMGYRSEEKHVEVMRMMADLLGVSGTDSEEIIEDAGGRELPDADESIITGPGIEGIKSMGPLVPQPSSQGLGKVLKANSHTLEFRSKTAPSASDFGEQEIPKMEQRAASSVTGTALSSSLKDRIGEGDSSIVYDVLPPALIKGAFEKLRDEVQWQAMLHRSGEVPRRVAVQGSVDSDWNRPLYRHPADFAPPLLPFTDTVDKIRLELSRTLRQPFNHVLIQLYRDGQDNISEHSDKTLDILRGSNIANVSLGAQRTMTLRSKKASGEDSATSIRNTQKVPMPHNSVFVLGASTNRRWLHGIRADKRRLVEKSDAERAYGGVRISLTFRLISTYTNESQTKIWGQGASSKLPSPTSRVITNDPDLVQEMIYAFGKENHESDFDWDAAYGKGFDVINTVSTPAAPAPTVPTDIIEVDSQPDSDDDRSSISTASTNSRSA